MDANGVMQAVYDPTANALRISGTGGGGAPIGASYITTAAESGLSSESVLGTDIIMRGAGASKPAASVAGRLYIETDGSLIVYRDSGSAWFEIARGGGAPGLNLIATAVKTANYSAAAGELVACDTSGGGFTVTLPTAPADKTTIAIKLVTAGNNLTVALGGSDVLNKAAGSTSFTLSLLNQAVILQYKATGAIWYVAAAELPLTAADARYVQTANNLSDVTAATARTNLGLGTSATHASTDYLLAANNLSDVTAATARTNLALAPAAKGSLLSASAANTMSDLAVGTNGYMLQADSGQTAGLGYSSRAFDFNGQTASGMKTLTMATGTGVATGISIAHSDASANVLSYKGINFTATTQLSNGASATAVGLYAQPTIHVQGNITSTNGIQGLRFAPTITEDGAGSWTLSHLDLVYTQWAGGTTTITEGNFYKGVLASANTVTTLYGVQIDFGNQATSGTIIGLKLKNFGGSTNWGMQVDVAASNYLGRLAIGGTTAATWHGHIQGGNSALTGLGIDVSTTGPTVPGSSAAGVISIYKGATNWYFLITFNDAGTTRYKYLQLNATGVTWVNNTVLPT